MAVNREQILQSAEKLLSRGKLDQALKEYLRVLEDNPKDIPTLNKVGDLYVRMNRPGESIPYFERIADFYSKDGFFLKAIAIYKKINKIDPARLEVYDRLADLYHKQGLVQDARSQYQVLADHYQKNNRIPDAIAVYKKMAPIDPGRPADPGAAGGPLPRRQPEGPGRHAVRPDRFDAPEARRARRGRAGLPEGARAFARRRRDAAQPRALAARAEEPRRRRWRCCKAAPRTGESLGLMAEAQLEMGERAEAVRTAEQALALDADAETPRLFLCRVRVQEHDLDKAAGRGRAAGADGRRRAANSRGPRSTSSRS